MKDNPREAQFERDTHRIHTDISHTGLRRSASFGITILGLTVLLLFGLFSCVEPLSSDLVTQKQDEEAPQITVTSHHTTEQATEPNLYDSSIVLTGEIIDYSYEEWDELGQLKDSGGFTYEYPGSASPVDIAVTTDDSSGIGSFSTTIDTEDLSGEMWIFLRAVDWNDNVTEVSLYFTDNGEGPYISLSTPNPEAPVEPYPTVLRISGSVANDPESAATDPPVFDEVKSLTWKIAGKNQTGTAEIDSTEGSFTFDVVLDMYDTDLTLVLTATDYNKNETVLQLVLKGDKDSDLSGFIAIPGSKKVDVSWEPFLNADELLLRYELWDFFNGFMVELDTDQTSYTYLGPDGTGLENGKPVLLVLEAVLDQDAILQPSDEIEGESEEEIDSDLGGVMNPRSEELKVIPLSRMSLVPRVSVGSFEIGLDWADIEGVDEYEVLRSETTDEDESYYTIGISEDSAFTDFDVGPNELYYYRIRPMGDPDMTVVSYAATGETNTMGDFEVKRITSLHTSYHDTMDVATSADGKYAFLLDNEKSGSDPKEYGLLTVVDILDNDTMDEAAGSLQLDMQVNCLEAAGTDLVLIGTNKDDDNDIRVINVSDPTAPVDLGNTFAIPSNGPVNLIMNGDVLYYSDDDGLYTYDISGLSDSPRTAVSKIDEIIGEADLVLTLAGSKLYAGGIVGRVDVYDVSSDTPSLDGGTDITIDDPDDFDDDENTDGDPLGDITSLAAIGTELCIADDEYHIVFADASTPGSITQVGDTFRGSDTAMEVVVADSSAGSETFAVASHSGIAMFDVSTASSPVRTYTLNSPSNSSESIRVVAGELIIASDGWAGMFAAQLPIWPFPDVISDGTFSELANTRKLEIRGNTLFAIQTDGTLYSIDLSASTPTTTRISTPWTFDTDLALGGLEASGDYLFLAADGNLVIGDISTPSSPTEVGTFEVGNSMSDILIKGDYAFLGDTEKGIHVIDVADPANPQEVSLLTTKGMPIGMEMRGDYLFAAAYSFGVQIWDVSDPEEPEIAGEWSDIEAVISVDVLGNYMYVMGWDSTTTDRHIAVVEIFEVSNPTTVGITAPWSGSLGYITVLNETLAVLCENKDYGFSNPSTGIRFVNIAEPSNPFIYSSDYIVTSGYTQDFVVSGDYAAAADKNDGLMIIDLMPDSTE